MQFNISVTPPSPHRLTYTHDQELGKGTGRTARKEVNNLHVDAGGHRYSLWLCQSPFGFKSTRKKRSNDDDINPRIAFPLAAPFDTMMYQMNRNNEKAGIGRQVLCVRVHESCAQARIILKKTTLVVRRTNGLVAYQSSYLHLFSSVNENEP